MIFPGKWLDQIMDLVAHLRQGHQVAWFLDKEQYVGRFLRFLKAKANRSVFGFYIVSYLDEIYLTFLDDRGYAVPIVEHEDRKNPKDISLWGEDVLKFRRMLAEMEITLIEPDDIHEVLPKKLKPIRFSDEGFKALFNLEYSYYKRLFSPE